MITYYFLVIITGILDLIATPISQLPNASLPSSLTAGLSSAGGYIAIVGTLFPLTVVALFGSLTIMVVVENADAIFKVVKWVYTKIPGIS
jgi:hypothetical protein